MGILYHGQEAAFSISALVSHSAHIHQTQGVAFLYGAVSAGVCILGNHIAALGSHCIGGLLGLDGIVKATRGNNHDLNALIHVFHSVLDALYPSQHGVALHGNDNANLLCLCGVGAGQAQFICTEVNACEIWLLPGKSAAVDKFSIGIILGNLLGSIKQLCTMGEHNVVFGIGIPADGVFNICGCNRLGEIYCATIFGCHSGSGVGSHLVPSAVVGTSGQD